MGFDEALSLLVNEAVKREKVKIAIRHNDEA